MTRADPKNVLVVVPVYNASRYLPRLVSRCRCVIGRDQMLFVNDGSTDDGLEVLKREHVNYISYPGNRGKGAALRAGFAYAIRHGYRSVLTLDADLQNLPEDIPRFLEAEDGCRLILGTRRVSRGEMPVERWLVNNLTSMIISIFSSQRVRDSQSGFRLIPTRLLRMARSNAARYDFESEILFQAGALSYRIKEVPVSTIYDGSHSHINPAIDTLRFVRQIWRRLWA